MFKAYHEDSGTNTINDYRSLTLNNSHASLTINWYFAWLILRLSAKLFVLLGLFCGVMSHQEF